MNRTNLDRAADEAQRFLQAAVDLRNASDESIAERKRTGSYYPLNPFSGSKQSGAVRRASMDLTRALAELRKP